MDHIVSDDNRTERLVTAGDGLTAHPLSLGDKEGFMLGEAQERDHRELQLP